MFHDLLPTPGICLKQAGICCLLSKDFWEVRAKEISPYQELTALEISGLRGPLEFGGAGVATESRGISWGPFQPEKTEINSIFRWFNRNDSTRMAVFHPLVGTK